MADEPKKFGESPLGQPGTPPLGQPLGQPTAGAQFTVDTSGMSSAYANFCRVTGTPEELVLDFGLNTQMSPVPTEPVKLTHRLVMNYFTAKRLLGALHMAVQQHENTYGVLETDIQKRMRAGAQPPRLGGGPPPR
ncbi:MAG TPA: DUF3467 domain-containing protein [Gemmataceae bacterium]|nr:DUF3467 domain-containing protein [Gemmataceae bacterium]